jgi:hypothetical protein
MKNRTLGIDQPDERLFGLGVAVAQRPQERGELARGRRCRRRTWTWHGTGIIRLAERVRKAAWEG